MFKISYPVIANQSERSSRIEPTIGIQAPGKWHTIINFNLRPDLKNSVKGVVQICFILMHFR